ncbi:ABC transporter substrate-binding protein [Loktanella sp. M215]|uniref:ABC transporter substrate-binding protein n=1 Tax=Loktanella sp. M215 TaxID=2675431 RepID=UPI001F2EA8AF|nr:ABC transporter substrate-binding protein [Loktanella sp. M215]MCF7700199.1 diguanylate cyclase [Loktanella sp. M215]
MTQTITTWFHPAARMYADEVAQGQLDRRAFLTRTTALGVTASAAYGLLGLQAPARAAEPIVLGGTLRMQMEVRAPRDPRAFDWPQIAYITAGWLEYLVEYHNDGTFGPWLLDRWEVNDDATVYTLHVRPGVTWNDGTPFTAADVARNIAGWCDKSVDGNSMAGRMATLIDPETGQAIAGAITTPDDLTVQLTLPRPDISLIAGMSDYPAQIVPAGFDAADMITRAKGTGPYLPEAVEVGVRAVLVRNADHDWWGYAAGKGAAIDRFEFIDYGTDPSAFVAAAAADEIDVIYETVGDYVEILDSMGWQKSQVASGSTIVIRPNQQAEVDGRKPYADVRVRRAIAMAVDPAVCLELGYADRGEVARNMHVGPMHPEWADIPAIAVDPAAALALMTEAGMQDYEMEITSVDDDWRKNTTDAVAAQLRDAGFKVKRTSVPGSTFAANWTTYPFSSTDWNHRPLGIQIYALAYRSGEAWNESGFANPAFDSLLEEASAIADADRRRRVMAELQTIMRDEGVVLQPYWRSIFRHVRPGVLGGEMNISYLPRLYAFGFAAPAAPD